MKLLAFETATEGCSVALWLDGEVRELFEVAPRRHAELVLPWADALLADAGIARSALDAVACGRGPGAFTGVRLAVAVTQGVAMGLDLPAVPVSTLAALAMQAAAAGGEPVLAAIDARMGEVYAGCFRLAGDEVEALDEERLAAPQDIVLPDAPRLHGAGTGFAAGDGVLATRLGGRLASVDPQALPHAADVARLAAAAFARGETLAAERLEPAYLRDKVALTLAEQRRP